MGQRVPGAVREIYTNKGGGSAEGAAAPWASQKRLHKERNLSGASKAFVDGQTTSVRGWEHGGCCYSR